MGDEEGGVWGHAFKSGDPPPPFSYPSGYHRYSGVSMVFNTHQDHRYVILSMSI